MITLQNGPIPKIWFEYLTTTHVHQKEMNIFIITHLIKKMVAPKQDWKWIERVGKWDRLGVLQWLGQGARVSIPWRQGVLVELPTGTKGEAPGISYQLPRCRVRGKRKWMWLKAVISTTSKNGHPLLHTDINFLEKCLFREGVLWNGMPSSRTRQLTKCTAWVVILVGFQSLIPPRWSVTLGRAQPAWLLGDAWMECWKSMAFKEKKDEGLMGWLLRFETSPWELVAICWTHHMVNRVVKFSLLHINEK